MESPLPAHMPTYVGQNWGGGGKEENTCLENPQIFLIATAILIQFIEENKDKEEIQKNRSHPENQLEH